MTKMDLKQAASLFNSVTKCLHKGVGDAILHPESLSSSFRLSLSPDSSKKPLYLLKRLSFLVLLHEGKYTSWMPAPKP